MSRLRPILLVACGGVLASAGPALAAPPANTACGPGLATPTRIGKPTQAVAWRAAPKTRVPAYGQRSEVELGKRHTVGPRDAAWLLVIDTARDAAGRCWVRVRLPRRPSGAAAWINSDNLRLRPTPWRIVVSRFKRTVTLHRDGKPLRTVRVVIGTPFTPTPGGLFAVLRADHWDPNAFLGSWIIRLTVHSRVLQEFDGGDGRVAIHGRGATSLLDPLGSARSHGCVRLSNKAINWLVSTIGTDQLPGTPVQIT
jgi:lipoprotein-anchoring transpeptidase ErfK/SrfK